MDTSLRLVTPEPSSFVTDTLCVCCVSYATLMHSQIMGIISNTTMVTSSLLSPSTGLTKRILQLQCDKSLFVAAAANQLLAHILNFPHPPITEQQTAQENGHPVSSITEEIVGHVGEALVCHEHFRVLQALRLLALSLPGCEAPLLGSVWRGALGPLEALLRVGMNRLSLPIMEVLQAAST